MILYFSPTALILVWTLLILSYMTMASGIGKPSDMFARSPAVDSPVRNENGYAVLSFLSAALIILGAKISLIHYYGSDLPFWDQWDTEPQLLYIAYDQGKLSWSSLFSPHNEHRLFFSRLWALSLYVINQQWDAHLQTVANAFLHTFFGLWLVWILWKLNEKKELWIMLGVFILTLAVPFSWENTLFAFQSSFYFLLGFSSMAILLIPQNQPFSKAWMIGIFFAFLSLFTMGSGFFAAAVSMALILIRAFRERRMTRSDGVSLVSCLLIVLAGILLIQVPEGHAVLRPKTFSDFLTALGKDLSWPWIDVPFVFPLFWSPFVILSYRIGISKKGNMSRYPFFIMGLGLWTLMQCVAVAYARGFEGSGPASRYMDSLSMIPIVNILAAHYLYRQSTAKFTKRKGFIIAFSCWYAFSIIGFLNLLINGSIEGFSNTGASLAKQSETVRHYLTSEDDDVILKARHMEIPYPDEKKLSLWLRDQAIRDLLPASVRKPLAVVPSVGERSDFVKNGFYPTIPVIKYWTVWGSFETVKGDRNTGYFTSERMAPPRRPYLRFQVAGFLDNSGLKLELYDMDHRLIEAIVPHKLPKEGWRSVDIPSPQVPFYIRATDQANGHGGWFAFSEPTEIGRFSRISESILSRGRTLLVMGLAFVLAIIVYAHLQKKDEHFYQYSVKGCKKNKKVK